ncbi:MAG: hypothetical protein IJH94_01870 [Clostridia bacterium]|nr:hypothetical protein [Clostridia bacterium]
MKRILLMIMAVIMSMTLGACSLADISGFTPATAEPDSGQGDTARDTAETPISYEITAGITDLDTYNPLTTASVTMQSICGFVFEPLFELDSQLYHMNVLAQEYSVSPDGRMLTVTLRPDVLWHDGTQFTAADVVYTVNYIKRGGTRYDGYMDAVSGAQALSNNVFAAYFSRPVPDPARLFTFPIIKNGSANYAEYTPVGTGPFFFDASGNLIANEVYYGGRAILNRINIRILPDNEKFLSLFDASAIDLATSDMLNMSSYMPKSNANVWDFISNELVFIGFNERRAVFAEPAARRAVSYLIDRDEIVSKVYFTRAAAVYYAVNPSSWMTFDTNKKHIADATGAREQLAGGGWTLNSSGVYTRVQNNRLISFNVRLLVNSDSPERVRIAELTAEAMKNAGMLVTIEKCPSEQFAARITAGNYDLFIGETNLKTNSDVSAIAATGSNSFGYSSADVDAKLAQLSVVTLNDDVKLVTRELHEILFNDAPYAPICFLKKSLVTSARLTYGIDPSISGYVRATRLWCNK